MPKYLPVKAHRQKPSLCGPSCLKMIFRYYGTHATEAQVARVAKSTWFLGTSIEGMKKAANHYGFTLRTKDNASFSDIQKLLKKGIPPIADWWSETDGHYSVVVGLDAKNIYLQDPELGKIRTMDRRTFYRCWFDFPKDFIRHPGDIQLRRLLIVEPKKKR